MCVCVCVCVCALHVNGCEKSTVIVSSGRSVFCCPPVSFPTHPLRVLQLQSISIETCPVLSILINHRAAIEQHLEGEIKIYLEVNGTDLNLHLVLEQATAQLMPGYKTLNHILDLCSNSGCFCWLEKQASNHGHRWISQMFNILLTAIFGDYRIAPGAPVISCLHGWWLNQ